MRIFRLATGCLLGADQAVNSRITATARSCRSSCRQSGRDIRRPCRWPAIPLQNEAFTGLTFGNTGDFMGFDRIYPPTTQFMSSGNVINRQTQWAMASLSNSLEAKSQLFPPKITICECLLALTFFPWNPQNVGWLHWAPAWNGSTTRRSSLL